MDLDGLIDMIPIGDIASKLGIDEKTAKAAVTTVLPTVVAGLAANSSSTDGAASLEKALTKHESKGLTVDEVDEEDGKKIVNHVFGTKKEAVTKAAAGKADVTQEIIAQVLPIVAPIVLSWLATQFLGGGKSAPAAKATKAEAPASSGGIGDILGGLLGSKGGQDVLGSVLGGLLGGK